MLIGLSMLIVSITAYENGAPIDVCSSMAPSVTIYSGHGAPAQSTGVAPYEITITANSYTPGVAVTGKVSINILYMYIPMK